MLICACGDYNMYIPMYFIYVTMFALAIACLFFNPATGRTDMEDFLSRIQGQGAIDLEYESDGNPMLCMLISVVMTRGFCKSGALE